MFCCWKKVISYHSWSISKYMYSLIITYNFTMINVIWLKWTLPYQDAGWYGGWCGFSEHYTPILKSRGYNRAQLSNCVGAFQWIHLWLVSVTVWIYSFSLELYTSIYIIRLWSFFLLKKVFDKIKYQWYNLVGQLDITFHKV